MTPLDPREQSSDVPQPGKLRNSDCRRPLMGPPIPSRTALEADGAYLFSALDTGKLSVFCDDCARYVELNARTSFALVAL